MKPQNEWTDDFRGIGKKNHALKSNAQTGNKAKKQDGGKM